MRGKLHVGAAFAMILVATVALGTPKAHVIAFGKWVAVQCFAGASGGGIAIKVRSLLVDGRMKEYVTGSPHEVTERLFVMRRAFRVNDSLPEDSAPRWQWERGGWLLVDRSTGRVVAINLPEFDPYFSAASWYRDYVAYCGIGDDGKKTYAIVAQLGRKKPVLRRPVGEGMADEAEADSACPAPLWQRTPVRVSFQCASGKQTFAIRGHGADVVNDDEED
jgi:hypothetical protein